VASKRKLDAELFALLAADPDPSVRHRVVCNTKVPAQLLHELSHDPDPFVRDAAAERLR
jgi:hypothetical protein